MTDKLLTDRKQQKSYYLPIALTNAIAQEAEHEGVSASWLVARILTHYLKSGIVFVPFIGTLDKDTNLSELFEKGENE